MAEVAARVSRDTLEAASPIISIARIRANKSIWSVSRSLRWRPETNRCVVSAASTMWRMRVESSGLILYRRGADNFGTEITAQILGGA